PFGTISKLT
ncbi:hypothetical protein VCHENC02_5689B, partial [Vibrio harveyi]